MLRDATASLTGGAPAKLSRGRSYTAPVSVALALFRGNDLPEGERTPAAKPEGAADDWRDEEDAWELQTPPETYLEQHPRGPNAAKARIEVARRKLGPSEPPPEASTGPSES